MAGEQRWKLAAVKRLPAPLTHPWFDAEFYNGVDGADRSFRVLNLDGSKIEFAQSQGLWMTCPCMYGKKGVQGSHHIQIPFRNPPSGIQLPKDHGPVDRDGRHPRWTVAGSGFADLDISPSISVGAPECWHGYIKRGIVRL